MGIESFLVEDKDGIWLPGRLFLSIVYLPCSSGGGDGLGDGVVGVYIGGEALQRGEHD